MALLLKETRVSKWPDSHSSDVPAVWGVAPSRYSHSLVRSVGALPHQSPPELTKDGDVTAFVDRCCVTVPFLEEKWADDALPAKRAPYGHLGRVKRLLKNLFRGSLAPKPIHSGPYVAQNRDQLNQGRQRWNDVLTGVINSTETDFQHYF